MRPAAPLIGPECYRNLRDLHPQFCRLDDKLKREFHARSPRINFLVKALGKSAHAAIRIPHTRMEKIVQDGSDDGIPQRLMQNRHWAGLDLPAKAISHTHSAPRRPLATDHATL